MARNDPQPRAARRGSSASSESRPRLFIAGAIAVVVAVVAPGELADDEDC